MPGISANGTLIEYEAFGDPAAPPILLIMGLGAQMINWDAEFCRQLADRGLYVVRFDNRDVGMSQKFEEGGTPAVNQIMAAALRGEPFETPYTLDDMAADAVGLMDALGMDKAIICGASMGGMIAQVVALNYPERVLALVSIMSTTGNPELAQATPEAQTALFTPPPPDRAGYIEAGVEAWRIIGSPGFPFNEDRVRARVTLAYDRGYCPEGIARQFVAIIASGNRKPALANIAAPTLVIHGSADPLVPVAGGYDTAEAIPGAELLVIEGMGHDFPRQAWDRIIEALAGLARRAGAL